MGPNEDRMGRRSSLQADRVDDPCQSLGYRWKILTAAAADQGWLVVLIDPTGWLVLLRVKGKQINVQ